MNLKDYIKILCIKENLQINELATRLGISRQNMYHHISKKTPTIISQIELHLNLSPNSLLESFSKLSQLK